MTESAVTTSAAANEEKKEEIVGDIKEEKAKANYKEIKLLFRTAMRREKNCFIFRT